jgi:2-oxoglutarate dehydrogenase E1 component
MLPSAASWRNRSTRALECSGPEHSSARIERFLALAAEGNIRIANPTTAAQYFHLLRRQALIRKPRPLVVFTPKGLLRLDRAAAQPEELTEGEFQLILDDPTGSERREKVERLVLCTGRVYYDLDANERRADTENVAIARVEMLYPFAKEQLEGLIASYPNLKEIAWVQEEPRNMGPRTFVMPKNRQLVPRQIRLDDVSRPERSRPAEGYPAAHQKEQARIVREALGA